ncbi:MAG: metalloregulator ArsR/SmtB family transcription factor [Lachnospiraceae bacterium]|nr:metalloregulator ArsR/SmtB family transcription factor [Lachnospiraceae bacterium]
MTDKKHHNNGPLPHDHGEENIEELLSHIPEDSVIQSVSAAMKQLGDPSRLRIFWLLCHAEECVINIAAAVGMTSPAVSHHLKLLKSAGLITSRREGKEMYYKAADTELVNSLHHIIEKVGEITCPF